MYIRRGDVVIPLCHQVLEDYRNGKALQPEDFGLNYQDRATEDTIDEVFYSLGLPLILDDL